MAPRRSPQWDPWGLPRLRDHVPGVPPIVAPMHIPLLRGNTHTSILNYLDNASRSATRLGVREWAPGYDPVAWWRSQGTARGRWSSDVRSLWDNRTQAMQLVAGELESQLPGFQGLARQFSYQPSYWQMDRFTGAVTDIGTGRIRMGNPAFRSPSSLVNAMMHEARHWWQARQQDFQRPALTKPYSEPTVLAEADAYLFDLEHRNLARMDAGRAAFELGRFRRYCDINDRLALGLPVDAVYTRPIDRGGWGISQIMNPVRRADLELRFSFVEPGLRRDLTGPYSGLWGVLPTTFSYQPMRPLSSNLRDLWRRSSW